MTRTTRELGISTVAALALGLAVLPADAQTVAPVLPFATSDADWAQYLSTPTSADQTTPTADNGSGQAWKRVGIGAGAVGAGGIFSFYVASAISSPRPLAKQSATPPVAPKNADPGPVVSQPGQAATGGAPSPAAPSAGSQGTSSSTSQGGGEGAASSSTPQGADDGSSSSTTASGSEGSTSSAGSQTGSEGASSLPISDAGSGGTVESTGTGAGWESTPAPITMTAGSITPDEVAPATATQPMFMAAAASAAPTVTPEPATLVLLMTGALALLFLNRRRRTA